MKSDYIVNVAYLCIHLVCLMSLHYLIAIFLCTKKGSDKFISFTVAL